VSRLLSPLLPQRRNPRRSQDWTLRDILSKIPVNACVHGFIKGRSTLTNARERLQGKIAQVNMVNPAQADRLKAHFDKVYWYQS
jgi:hypothetical protein